jgi:hypothetical protein
VTAGVPRPLASAGGPFQKSHRARLGPEIDLGDLSIAAVPEPLLPLARSAWLDRVRSEFRSIQIMTRFLTEVTGAGDPLDVYASVVALIDDEILHTELCAAVCARLGVTPLLPDPAELRDADDFLRAPMPERALSTAISMLLINETISSALITDLLARCDYDPIRRVLATTIEGEAGHSSFGWDYVRASLARFDGESLSYWRGVASNALAPHRALAAEVASRSGRAGDELDLARFGLLSAERQAAIFERTFETMLGPRLAELGLLERR